VKKLVLALSLCVMAGVVAPSAHSAAPLAAPIGPIRTLAIGGSGGNAFNTAYSSGDVTGTILRTYDVTAFNSQTPAQLRASYDVIMVAWEAGGGFNLDWNTRLLPFLQMGGGVIFEDPSNISDLAPAVTGTFTGASTPYVVTPVPGLTDGVVGTFSSHIHFSVSAWDPAIFSPFLTGAGGSPTIGLYGQVPGGGRIVVTGPDPDYHASRPSDEYTFILNALEWVHQTGYERLRLMIAPLVAPGKLTQRYADTLLQLVNRAEAYANAGARSQAISMLRSFLSYVQRYVNSGWITPAEATALQNEANALISGLSP
jgi:hypothetical protein